jgi:hypothetical protein
LLSRLKKNGLTFHFYFSDKIMVKEIFGWNSCLVPLGDRSKMLEYYPKPADDQMYNIHLGQLKLMISELQLILNFVPQHKTKRVVIVYAGSAPGNHIPFLSQMFPDIIFHLYDKNKFSFGNLSPERWKHHIPTKMDDLLVSIFDDARKQERIHIHTVDSFFTDDIAKLYNQYVDGYCVVLISDIRRNVVADDQNEVIDSMNENTIIEDMNAQMRWVELMNPETSMLKFRLPYGKTDASKQIVNRDAQTTEYFAGTLFFGVFAPVSSTEMRLVPAKRLASGEYHKVIYNNVDIEQLAAYHNRKVRKQDEQMEYVVGGEQIMGYDQAAYRFVLSEYLNAVGIDQKHLNRLYENIQRSINLYREGPRVSIERSLHRLKYAHYTYPQTTVRRLDTVLKPMLRPPIAKFSDFKVFYLNRPNMTLIDDDSELKVFGDFSEVPTSYAPLANSSSYIDIYNLEYCELESIPQALSLPTFPQIITFVHAVKHFWDIGASRRYTQSGMPIRIHYERGLDDDLMKGMNNACALYGIAVSNDPSTQYDINYIVGDSDPTVTSSLLHYRYHEKINSATFPLYDDTDGKTVQYIYSYGHDPIKFSFGALVTDHVLYADDSRKTRQRRYVKLYNQYIKHLFLVRASNADLILWRNLYEDYPMGNTAPVAAGVAQ